jgi:hypothetical protein
MRVTESPRVKGRAIGLISAVSAGRRHEAAMDTELLHHVEEPNMLIALSFIEYGVRLPFEILRTIRIYVDGMVHNPSPAVVYLAVTAVTVFIVCKVIGR